MLAALEVEAAETMCMLWQNRPVHIEDLSQWGPGSGHL